MRTLRGGVSRFCGGPAAQPQGAHSGFRRRLRALCGQPASPRPPAKPGARMPRSSADDPSRPLWGLHDLPGVRRGMSDDDRACRRGDRPAAASGDDARRRARQGGGAARRSQGRRRTGRAPARRSRGFRRRAGIANSGAGRGDGRAAVAGRGRLRYAPWPHVAGAGAAVARGARRLRDSGRAGARLRRYRAAARR